MKKHVNIPIFIPHLGCPNQCVFCNQRTISGVEKFDIASVNDEIKNALSTIDDDTDAEIAFFGGSFTGIDRSLMISLLEIAYEYVLNGKVTSIRCSTRPDYIDEEILNILKQYSVKVIELGLQSSDDYVLRASKRGHDLAAEEKACRLIVDSGFDLVGQMMIGLPGSNIDSEIKTAEFIVRMGAVGARIYPTVVFNDTELCNMSMSGEYAPISLDDAVKRSANVLKIFRDNNLEVIRIGLCSSENLTDKSKYYAGPNHPAIGEMVEAEVYFDIIIDLLQKNNLKCPRLLIKIPKGEMSKVVGHKKHNKERLIRDYGFKNIKFKEDESLSEYQIIIEEEREKECT